jgi:hypothetical protein
MKPRRLVLARSIVPHDAAADRAQIVYDDIEELRA